MVVSDTSPIVNLAAIERLNLLRILYGTIHIPEAVYREITDFEELPGAEEVRTLDWIVRRPCRRDELVVLLSEEVDPGEAEAIALAVETDAKLLIDEKIGRRFAYRLGLRQTGLLGVLVEAKKQGHIAAVRPLLRDLVERAGFWMSQALQERVLAMVDEV